MNYGNSTFLKGLHWQYAILLTNAIYLLFASFANSATVQFSEIKALNGVLPQKTEHYEIETKVDLAPPYYRFDVISSHGPYEVQSIKNLLKVCHEIRVMEEYGKTDEGNQTWKGAKDTFKDIGSGAKMLVKDPNAARKAIGRSLSKTARSIGRFFRKSTKKTEERKSSEGRNRDIGAGGTLYAKTARQFANRLQLDVYTDNPYATSLIKEVAEDQGAGKAAVGVATFLIAPVPGIRTVTRGSLTSDAIDAETEILITDNTPEELRYQLRKKFSTANSRSKTSAFDTFLANGNFNPRQTAYLAAYLRVFKSLDQHKEAIEQLGAITTETDADFITSQYEMLTALHLKKSQLKKLVPIGSIIGGLTEDGVLIVPTPFDTVKSSDYVTGLLGEIKTAATKVRAKETRLHLIGAGTGEINGVKIVGNILHDPELSK